MSWFLVLAYTDFLSSLELGSLNVEHHVGERLLEGVGKGDIHLIGLVPGELHRLICHYSPAPATDGVSHRQNVVKLGQDMILMRLT